MEYDIAIVVLGGRLVLSQLNGACHSSSMEPSVGIHGQGLTGESLEVAWFVDRLEQREKAFNMSV